MQEPTSYYTRRSDSRDSYYDAERNSRDWDDSDERNKEDWVDNHYGDIKHNGDHLTQPKRQPLEHDNIETDEDGKVRLLDHYKFRQSYGIFSILFSMGQIAILATMMLECGIAPLNINPMIGPYPDVMSYWGAKNAVLILDEGETWRLLTPILLHAGVLHLLGNVHVQFDLGVFFEKEWGSLKWLIVYLTSGVGSSILSVYFMPNNISVGSSGSIMGLFGAKLSEIFCKWYEPRDGFLDRVAHAVRREQLRMCLGGVTLVMLLSFIPFVDWAAHLGGLLAGIAIGMVLFSVEKKDPRWRIVWFVVGIVLTIIYYGKTIELMYSGVEPIEELKDVCGYYKQYFDDYECVCTKEENKR